MDKYLLIFCFFMVHASKIISNQMISKLERSLHFNSGELSREDFREIIRKEMNNRNKKAIAVYILFYVNIVFAILGMGLIFYIFVAK